MINASHGLEPSGYGILGASSIFLLSSYSKSSTLSTKISVSVVDTSLIIFAVGKTKALIHL